MLCVYERNKMMMMMMIMMMTRTVRTYLMSILGLTEMFVCWDKSKWPKCP